MEMRALWSESLFSPFFRFISENWKMDMKKACPFLKIPKEN